VILARTAHRKLWLKAGVGLIRYWSFFWDQLEPAKGKNDYEHQDYDVALLQQEGFVVQAMVPHPVSGWSASVPYDYGACLRAKHWAVYWHAKPNYRWDRPRYEFPFRVIQRPGGGRAFELLATRTSSRDSSEGLPRLHQHGDYHVRLAAILFGNGVDNITYHLSYDGLSTLMHPSTQGTLNFEYDYQPRKVYPVQAALSHMVTPDTKIARKMHLHDGSVYAYIFTNSSSAVAIVWSPDLTYRFSVAESQDVHVLDLFGEPLDTKEQVIGASPIYLQGSSAEILEKVIKQMVFHDE